MTQRTFQVIEAARALSVPERLELIHAVSKSVADDCRSLSASSDFWVGRSLEESATEQGVSVVQDISSLAGSFWPEEETTDAFLDFLAEQRLADRLESV